MKLYVPFAQRVRLLGRLDLFLERFPGYIRAKYGTDLSRESIVVVTIDSLRFDVAQQAETPHIRALFRASASDGWIKVGSHGTYTLPSHISMFHAGIFPCDNRPDVPPPYNREKEKLFKAQLAWERTTGARFPTPAAPNIVRGFERMGYRTLGVGGVHWFNDRFITSDLWKTQYFREFHWKEDFSENCSIAFENQIGLIRKLRLDQEKRPVFLFLNVSSTHTPYMGFGRSLDGQKKALEYVDSHLPELLDVLPDRFLMLLLSDHGECFGEDGLWGHSFYHPSIMEVPFACIAYQRDRWLSERGQGGQVRV